jgi:hypothetical protein
VWLSQRHYADTTSNAARAQQPTAPGEQFQQFCRERQQFRSTSQQHTCQQ